MLCCLSAEGVVPGVTTCTIDVTPSPVGDRENCVDSVGRPAPPDVDRRRSTVEVPSQPPILSSGAARALVRVLLKASGSDFDATVPDDGGPDVLAILIGMKRFAFYGRVSTEDQQDPVSSRNWQLARSRH